jgi:hypothetical protein
MIDNAFIKSLGFDVDDEVSSALLNVLEDSFSEWDKQVDGYNKPTEFRSFRECVDAHLDGITNSLKVKSSKEWCKILDIIESL